MRKPVSPYYAAMCGRFVSPEERALERVFDLGRRDNPSPFARRYNVCPTDKIPFLRQPANASRPELALGRWGMVPHWWKEAKPPRTSFNARLEEAADKPMWRDAFARSRCLIPAEGWYEWQAVEREGVSVFAKDAKGRVFRTYSTFARGIEALNLDYRYLDVVPKGRDEGGRGPFWVRRHDEYGR